MNLTLLSPLFSTLLLAAAEDVPAPPTAPSEPVPGTAAAAEVSPPPAPPALDAPAASPAPAPAPEAAPPSTPPAANLAGYKDGFFLQSPDGAFKLKVRGLAQVRGTANVPVDAPDDATVTAAIQRAQLDFGGNVFTKQLSFLVKTELGQGFTFVKDAWVNYAFVPGTLELRVGQWKRPFSRQQLVGDGKQGFVDRTITDGAFATGRDIGIALHDDLDKSPAFEWAVGAFAGAKEKPDITAKVVRGADGTLVLESAKISNAPAMLRPTFVARAGANFGEVKGYSELDDDGGAPRAAVALSVLEAVELGDAQGGRSQVELDGVLKLYGADANAAVYLGAAQTGAGSFDQGPDAYGAHVQAGYLIDHTWHPSVRYALVGKLDGSGEQHEVAAAFVWLFFGQNLQWQTEGAALIERSEVDGVHTDARLRMQLVFAF